MTVITRRITRSITRAIARGGGAVIAAQYVSNLKLSNTVNLRAGIAAVKAGSASANIICDGDSTTEGAMASADGLSSNRAFSWPNRMPALLNALDPAFSAVASSVWSLGGESSTANYALYNPELAFGIGWLLAGASATVPGGRPTQVTNVTVTATRYTPTSAFDSFIIGTRSSATIGLEVRDDTGTIVLTTTGTSTNDLTLTTVNMGHSSAYVDIQSKTGSAGTSTLCSIFTFNAADKKLYIHNRGWRGSLIADWLTTTQNYNPGVSSYAFPGVCLVLDMCINDVNAGTAIATYVAGLRTKLLAHKAAGQDVILSNGVPSNPASRASQAVQDQYSAAMLALAIEQDVPFLDRRAALGGTYAQMTANGWAAGGGDDLHPNRAGHLQSAQPFYNLIAALP